MDKADRQRKKAHEELMVVSVILLSFVFYVPVATHATTIHTPVIEPFKNYAVASGLADSPWPMFGQNPQHSGQSAYIAAQNANLKWSKQVASHNWGAPSPTIGTDGTVYVGSDKGFLYAFNPDGELIWKYETGHVVLSSAAIASDGTIYFGCSDNNIYALNRDGSLKWKYLTGGFVSSSPAIGSDGTIYVGSGDGYLYAINVDGTLK